MGCGKTLKTEGPAAMAARPFGLYFYYSGLGEIVGQDFGKQCAVQFPFGNDESVFGRLDFGASIIDGVDLDVIH
jgi:hypothetical protein